MSTTDRNARTGRTTRMLAEARRLAREGRAVYVVCANLDHVRGLSEIAGPEAKQLGIKFETEETIGNLDWQTMVLRRAHRNCVVLADNWAIENRFGAMLEMLHRFDLPAAGVERVYRTDATVHRILKGGGDLADCVGTLAAEKKALARRITELESIAPKKLRLADGGIAIWHCPDHLIPIQENPAVLVEVRR